MFKKVNYYFRRSDDDKLGFERNSQKKKVTITTYTNDRENH